MKVIVMNQFTSFQETNKEFHNLSWSKDMQELQMQVATLQYFWLSSPLDV